MAYGANFPAMFRQAADYVMDRAPPHGVARVRGTGFMNVKSAEPTPA